MYTSFNPRAAGLAIGAVETIELAAEAGFEGVDLLVRDLLAQGEDPAELRRRIDALGLRGGAFPLPVSWRRDAAEFAADLAALPRIADAAAELGLLRTCTWAMPERPPGLDEAQTQAIHVDRIGAIADVLAARGIQIGIEAIGVRSFRTAGTPAYVTRLGDASALRSILDGRCGNVGIVLDTWHLYASEERLDDALAAGPVVWVHVADVAVGATADRGELIDSRRGLPRAGGVIDNRGILATLARRGYAGPVTAEPLGECPALAGLDPRATAHAVARALRAVRP